ncbi:hypothetical protein LIER_22366 [Lithospermum erythrorhizon]|uniref:Uncharacterized protein n=1 Tax=Lithospermum erythrorhizon TaxID=34254 RepID=A0AAV3QZD1_LITER
MEAPAQATDVVAFLHKQMEVLTERVTSQTRRGTNTELARLAPFSPEIRSETMPMGMKLPFFTMFMRKTDQEEHIVEFLLEINEN